MFYILVDTADQYSVVSWVLSTTIVIICVIVVISHIFIVIAVLTIHNIYHSACIIVTVVAVYGIIVKCAAYLDMLLSAILNWIYVMLD